MKLHFHPNLGVVESHQFAAVVVKDPAGQPSPLGFEQSKAPWEVLREKGYIDDAGKVQHSLRTALKDDAVEIPDAFKPQAPEILEMLRKVAGKLEIKDANKKLLVKPNRGVLKSVEFRGL